MDPTKRTRPLKKGTGPLGVCPYLGVQDDPATHFAWAKPGHFCYRVRPPQAIESGHQENYCLSGKYPTCIVYPASWKGGLPPSVRDDAYTDWAKRAAVIKSSITSIGGSQASAKEEVEKSTSRFGIDLSTLRDQSDFIEEEPPAIPWWRTRFGKLALFVLVAIPLVIIGIWAIMEAARLLPRIQASADLPGGEEITATWQALQAYLPSPTQELPAVVLPPTNTPQPTPTSSSTPSPLPPTPIPTTPVPSSSPTQEILPSPTVTTSSFTCDQIEAYTFEISQGPILVPELGYIYSSSTAPSNAKAGWLLTNTGSCTWEQVLLLSISSNRLLIPYMVLNGEVTVPDSPDQGIAIPPGGQLEVGLAFPLSMARGVRGEWGLVINGFRLVGQAHLVLDVSDWVIGIDPTSTQQSRNRSPGRRDESPSETAPATRP